MFDMSADKSLFREGEKLAARGYVRDKKKNILRHKDKKEVYVPLYQGAHGAPNLIIVLLL